MLTQSLQSAEVGRCCRLLRDASLRSVQQCAAEGVAPIPCLWILMGLSCGTRIATSSPHKSGARGEPPKCCPSAGALPAAGRALASLSRTFRLLQDATREIIAHAQVAERETTSKSHPRARNSPLAAPLRAAHSGKMQTSLAGATTSATTSATQQKSHMHTCASFRLRDHRVAGKAAAASFLAGATFLASHLSSRSVAALSTDAVDKCSDCSAVGYAASPAVDPSGMPFTVQLARPIKWHCPVAGAPLFIKAPRCAATVQAAAGRGRGSSSMAPVQANLLNRFGRVVRAYTFFYSDAAGAC